MNPQTLTSLLTNAGLGSQSSMLAALARPAIRIATQPVDDATLPIGSSKIGGAPDLPPGTAWPTFQNLPMSFLAQFHLADLVAYDSMHALPSAGLLSFFYDARQQIYGDNATDRAGWHVFFVADPISLTRLPLPAQLTASARFHACQVTFHPFLTLPQQPQLETPTLQWTATDQQRYEQFITTNLNQQGATGPQHQMLGYPDTLQDDMRAQCQAGLYPSQSDVPTQAASPSQEQIVNWQLLLQLDSDEHANMQWSDGGMLYFWIQRSDLQQANFQQTWCILQTT